MTSRTAATAAPRSHRRIVVINTVLCLLAIIPAFLLQIGAVMVGAAVGACGVGAFIALAGLILPVVPIISIAGSWLTLRWRRLSLAFVILPWAFLAILLGAMALLFTR